MVAHKKRYRTKSIVLDGTWPEHICGEHRRIVMLGGTEPCIWIGGEKQSFGYINSIPTLRKLRDICNCCLESRGRLI